MSSIKTQPLFTATLLLLASATVAHHEPTQLEDRSVTPNIGYQIYYTDNDTDDDGTQDTTTTDFFSAAQAQVVAEALDTNNNASPAFPGHHQLFLNHGFNAPNFSVTPPEVHCWDCTGCDIASAPLDVIRVDVNNPLMQTGAEPCIRGTIGHELFHHVQFSYINFNQWTSWGSWSVEGTARKMQDNMYADLDGNVPGSCITYLGEVGNYLGDTNRTLWNTGYEAALFWTYLAEQLGTTIAEPERGVDFIRSFWQSTAGQSPDGIRILRDTISTTTPTSNLETMFQDFTITNAAKDLDQSALSANVSNRKLPNGSVRSRYQYVDDDLPNAAYDNVNWTFEQTMSNQIGPQSDGPGTDVVRWGAKYYRVTGPQDGNSTNDPDPFNASCEILGFKSTGDFAAYGLIGVRDNDRVTYLSRSQGTSFAGAVLNNPADPYEQLLAVVAGLNDPVDYEYTFACGEASLEILSPTFRRLAFLGDPAAPERFLLQVEVSGPSALGEPSVMGLLPDDFQVYIGGQTLTDAATVISASYVQGQYWLVLQPPTKPAAGIFDLTVRVGNVTDSEDNAVNYVSLRRDQVIVIDRSGSMASTEISPKIDAAKNAARLFVDSAATGDKLGIVTFYGDGKEPNVDSRVIHNLADIDSVTRIAAKRGVDSIHTQCTSSDCPLTSIGDGLDSAQDQLNAYGNSSNHQQVIVLLSDGIENEGMYWDGSPSVKAKILNSNTIVYAIALGPLTNQELLQDISSSSGGVYHYVTLEQAGGGNPVTLPSQLANRVANVYRLIAESVLGHERLWYEVGTVSKSKPVSKRMIIDEGGVKQAIFSVNWPQPDARLMVELRRPDGTIVRRGDPDVSILNDRTHVIFQMKNVPPGSWNMRVSTAGSEQPIEYVASFSGKLIHGVQIELLLAQHHSDAAAKLMKGEFLRGLPMTFFAVLTDIGGPVRGADVVVDVRAPDGGVTMLRLVDDGTHGDNAANDGVYTNIYTRTAFASYAGRDDRDTGPGSRGSYLVDLVAVGASNKQERFRRFASRSFHLFDHEELHPDEDQDGMPTRWEQQFRLDPTVDDSKDDPDFDNLANIREFLAGTNPINPDTDHGGEGDGSEIRRGANPFDANDDALPRPLDTGVVDFVTHIPTSHPERNSNLIYFPINDAHKRLRIYRTSDITKGFVLVAEIDPRKFQEGFRDTGLKNGVKYYYRIEAIGAGDSVSASSHIFAGVPKEDPLPPDGWGLTINDNIETTSSTTVVLTLDTTTDAVEVLISNSSSFKDAKWEPLKQSKKWIVSPNPKSGRAFVYAIYRDAAGNESIIYHDGIVVE